MTRSWKAIKAKTNEMLSYDFILLDEKACSLDIIILIQINEILFKIGNSPIANPVRFNHTLLHGSIHTSQVEKFRPLLDEDQVYVIKKKKMLLETMLSTDLSQTTLK